MSSIPPGTRWSPLARSLADFFSEISQYYQLWNYDSTFVGFRTCSYGNLDLACCSHSGCGRTHRRANAKNTVIGL